MCILERAFSALKGQWLRSIYLSDAEASQDSFGSMLDSPRRRAPMQCRCGLGDPDRLARFLTAQLTQILEPLGIASATPQVAS